MKRVYVTLFTISFLLNSWSVKAQQDKQQSWVTAKAKVENRLSSIKSLQAYLQVAVYNEETYRKSQIESWGRTLPEGSTEDRVRFDPNKSISYFWITDGRRWRCERNYNHPKQRGYYIDAFDGEEFTYYRQDKGIAWIASQPTYDEDALTDLQSSRPLGFDFLESVARFEVQRGVQANFTFIASTTVAGLKCDQYRFDFDEYSFSVWINSDTGAIAKYQTFFVSKDSEGGFVYQVIAFQVVDGTTMPKKVQFDSYTGPRGKAKWLQTRTFNFTYVSLNRSLSEGDFRNFLRVGTEVENQVEDPGTLEILGGSTDVDQVQRGESPKILGVPSKD